MGAREYIISAVLVGLFVFAFLSFAYYGANDNQGRNIVSDSKIANAYYNMSGVLQGFQNDSNTQLNNTSSETPTASFGSLVMFSITKAGTVFTGSITGVYRIISVLLVETLGIPPLIINVLTGVMLVSIIFFLWRMYRLGT